MAGLNNLISNTAQQTTTLPGWFDTAQQNVVNQAGSAMGAAPTPQQTVGQQAVNALSGPTNAFTQAGGTLQSIASGAANPWITNPQTGQVTPDTSTAMGGLFQAQNQQLQQLMPNITAQPGASSIGAGQFGSLRGQTATNKAMADAQAQMNAAQYQAALQNQQTGVQAGSAAGNVAQQNINNLLTTGQYQQAAPFTNVSNYGKILGGIQAPTTVQNQTQLSPLNQYAGMLSLLGGSTGTGGVLSQLGVTGGLQGLMKGVGSALGLFSGSGANASTAENQAGGFYGGTAPTNPYTNMTDAQIQAAMDQNFPTYPTQDQLNYLDTGNLNVPYDGSSGGGGYVAPNFEE
tara:strand:- start:704 stop:1741 length:1038 start_codon:yes stop_codon:yes gene_type:complete